MKNFILTAAAATCLAAAGTAQEGYVPSVAQTQNQYGVAKMSANPDFSQLPIVETGLPSMNLPGMSMAEYDGPTGRLVEGFSTGYTGGYVTSRVNSVSDRASSGENDPDNSKWIDRDNDGYDPVVDEIEQGAETAVKATGQALEEVGEEVGELFGNEDPDDVGEPDSERGILGKVVNGTGKAVKGTAKAGYKVTKGAVKTTGKVARGTVKTTGKVAKGTVKTTGKVVRGTGKAVTKPLRRDKDGNVIESEDSDGDTSMEDPDGNY